MTQEEKDLVLRDICGRFPYGVIMQVTMYDIQGKYDEDRITTNVKLSDGNIGYIMRESHWISYKPYLRPMSSMTEEEQKEFVKFHCVNICPIVIIEDLTISNESEMFDWFNAHHFDYRGLIEKGLAISTEEFNPYN